MKVRHVDDTMSAAWDDYLASKPESSFYHRYEWRRFFTEYFGKETVYLAAVDADSSIRGVLPLVRMQSLIFGDFYVSLPFVNYGGIVSDAAEAFDCLISEASSLATSQGVSHIEYRHVGQDCDFPCRTDKVAMLLDLPGSVDDLSTLLGAKRRSQIRRPLRENPVVQFGGDELLDEFYAVFARNMRDLGTPVYAKSMFAYLLEHHCENAKIVTIRIGDRAAAAAFLLHDETRVEIPWASTVREFNKISINMLLYWEVLKHAIETGRRVFDFGRSTVDSGTYRFKKQWGAQPIQLNWHYWLREKGELPQLNPQNPKFRLAVTIWQKLPVAVANALGPRIVKHLP